MQEGQLAYIAFKIKYRKLMSNELINLVKKYENNKSSHA